MDDFGYFDFGLITGILIATLISCFLCVCILTEVNNERMTNLGTKICNNQSLEFYNYTIKNNIPEINCIEINNKDKLIDGVVFKVNYDR